MYKFSNINIALARAIATIAAVGVMVTGVTFAALQSQQAVLSGNTIQSASANLLIGTASPTSTAYSSSSTGFSFTDVVPGGPAQPANGSSFYLKNTGTATLTLKMAVGSTPTNTSSVDLSKVSIIVTRVDTGTTQTVSLQSLIDTGGGLKLTDTLAPAATGVQYTISVSMAADAFTGSSASIGAVDFVFSGTAAI